MRGPTAVSFLLSFALCAPAARAQSKLRVTAPDGAQIHLDGRAVGVAPLPEPLDVAPGKRRLTVAMNGHEPVVEELAVKRGVTRAVTVELEPTWQRVAASMLIAGGGAGVAAGIVLGVFSTVNAVAADRARTQQERSAFEAKRDDFTLGATVSALSGIALFVVGGGLFILDEPNLSLQPEIGPPHHGGATLRLRF